MQQSSLFDGIDAQPTCSMSIASGVLPLGHIHARSNGRSVRSALSLVRSPANPVRFP
jgi:hypothetical protein